MLDTTPELFDQHIAVNLRAPFFLMQAAIADMKQRGEPGTIVNVISIDSHGGQSFLAPYVAAKAGLAGLTKNAAHAHRWDRIRINGLNMGWSATDGEDQTQRRAAAVRGLRAQGAGGDWQAAAGATLPMGKLGQPDEIADFVVVPAVRPQRRRHRLGHRLGPDRHRRPRMTHRTVHHRYCTTPFEKENIMRLGLIGLGRIGAFHADTLSTLPTVDSLVVTDFVPAVTKTVAEKVGAEAADSPESLISSGVDGDRHRRGDQCAHPTDQGRRRGRNPGVLREAAVRRHRRGRGHRPVRQRQRRAGADRVPAPLRPGVRRRPGGRRGRRTRLGAHGPVHHPRPGAGATRIHRGVRRHLPGLQRARLRHRPVGHRPGGRRGLRHRQRQGRRLLRRIRRCRHRQTLLTFDDGATAVVSNTRYNPRGYDVRLELHGTGDSVAAGWSDHTPLRNLEPGVSWPAGPPATFFMDRLTAAFRAELQAFTEVVAGQRKSPCTVDDAMAVAYMAEAATLSLQQHRPVQIDEVRAVMTTPASSTASPAHPSPGASAKSPTGATSSPRNGCSPRCRTSACPPPNSARTASCRPTRTRWPRCSTPTT